MSPEERERLRPSAPQSDRRKRVARIKPDSMSNHANYDYHYHFTSIVRNS